jgi:hypothetical protein
MSKYKVDMLIDAKYEGIVWLLTKLGVIDRSSAEISRLKFSSEVWLDDFVPTDKGQLIFIRYWMKNDNTDAD